MTLINKLRKVNRPFLPKMENGTAQTIKEFYDTFIEPHLPQNIENVIAWHKMLKEYVQKPDAVLGFRTGNVAGSLRRGWETITTDGYSFFYTDNFGAHFYYKLAYDADWEPNLEEYYRVMKDKLFPVRFPYFMDREEKKRAGFIVNGRNPGLGGAGYYLAHIIDAGDNIVFNGRQLGLAEIITRYFNLEQPEKWTLNVETQKYCRNNFDIPEADRRDARKLAEICFLRMVHPMNYFLSPKSKTRGKIYNTYQRNETTRNDIGEYSNVISYVRQKLHERYTVNGTDYFQEFLDLVCPMEDNIHEDGNTVINLSYSARALNAPQQDNARPVNRNAQAPRAQRNEGAMDKNQAIELFRDDEYDFNGPITFASINSAQDVYWMTPKFSMLEDEWNIILNDTDKRKLYLLVIPANTISRDQVSTKAGSPDKMNIELQVRTYIDRKSPCNLSFEQWFMHSIDY